MINEEVSKHGGSSPIKTTNRSIKWNLQALEAGNRQRYLGFQASKELAERHS
tara:strand:- start:311 stop:466 length:156 start_codon:yes stop_codon:yes gene_type:complete